MIDTKEKKAKLMMKFVSLTFLISTTFSQSSHKLTKTNLYLEETNKITSDGKVSFSLIGDWGGDQTTGDLTQLNLNISESLDKTAPVLDTDFLLLLGDNFYDTGVENLESDRFDQKRIIEPHIFSIKATPIPSIPRSNDDRQLIRFVCGQLRRCNRLLKKRGHFQTNLTVDRKTSIELQYCRFPNPQSRL